MANERCRLCRSYAINPHMYDREPGVDLDLCDVCYWKTRAEQSTNRKHVLYETADKDRPEWICDGNGEVVLSLCRVCGGAECSLPTNCPGRCLTLKESDLICAGELDF